MLYTVGQKTGPFLKDCHSVWWYRKIFRMSKCSVLYLE